MSERVLDHIPADLVPVLAGVLKDLTDATINPRNRTDTPDTPAPTASAT
ncbi:hypothetical protein ACFXKX_22750 [Streptomyces scopuliridis]